MTIHIGSRREVKQEMRGVALEPDEVVLDKAQATFGHLGTGELSLTSRRLLWSGAPNLLPFAPSWFVPGWRVVIALVDIRRAYHRGSVLVVDGRASYYEFGLRTWLLPSRTLAKRWAISVDAECAAVRAGNTSG